jgi:hypothetical protein
MKKTLEMIIAVCVLTGMVFGGIQYFATAKDLRQVEQRLDQKIVSDSILQISQRIWSLEDRHRDEGKDERFWSSHDDAAEYRALKRQLEDLKLKQINMLKKE